MPYSFVWLYLIKCVFTCSICVNSSTKRFLSVLGIFGKFFVWKIWKFQKSSFALFWRLSRGYVKSRASVASSRVIFGDLFASGRSSRVVYSEIFVAQLATHSFQSRKSYVLDIQGQFLNFLFFPRSFCDCSLSFSSVLTHSHRVSIFDLHCLPLFRSKSSTNRYGFSVLNFTLPVVMVFPLDYSHLILFLWWVFSSTITLCPCLAYGRLCFCFELVYFGGFVLHHVLS